MYFCRQIRCTAGIRRYYDVVQKKLPYLNCYITEITATRPEIMYSMALRCMHQGKGGSTIHSRIKGLRRKYFVGNNWTYNINSSEGAQNETYKFSELCIKGVWHLLSKPMRGQTVILGQEVEAWYPWKNFTITTYLNDKDYCEHNEREESLNRIYPHMQKST